MSLSRNISRSLKSLLKGNNKIKHLPRSYFSTQKQQHSETIPVLHHPAARNYEIVSTPTETNLEFLPTPPFPQVNPVKFNIFELWAIYRLCGGHVSTNRGDYVVTAPTIYMVYHGLVFTLQKLIQTLSPVFYDLYVKNVLALGIKKTYVFMSGTHYHDLANPLPTILREMVKVTAQNVFKDYPQNAHSYHHRLQRAMAEGINLDEIDILPSFVDNVDITMNAKLLPLIVSYYEKYYLDLVPEVNKIIESVSKQSQKSPDEEQHVIVRLYRNQLEHMLVRHWITHSWTTSIVEDLIATSPFIQAFAKKQFNSEGMVDVNNSTPTTGDVRDLIRVEILPVPLAPNEPALRYTCSQEEKENGENDFSIPLFEFSGLFPLANVVEPGNISGLRQIVITHVHDELTEAPHSLLLKVMFSFDNVLMEKIIAKDCSVINDATISRYITPTMILGELRSHETDIPETVQRVQVLDNRQLGSRVAVEERNRQPDWLSLEILNRAYLLFSDAVLSKFISVDCPQPKAYIERQTYYESLRENEEERQQRERERKAEETAKRQRRARQTNRNY